MKKKILTFFCALLMTCTMVVNVMAAQPTHEEVGTKAVDVAKYLSSVYQGEIIPDQYFYVFLIAASGLEDDTIAKEFLASVEENIKSNGKLMRDDDNKAETPEFYGSVIMALKACGFDPTNVSGRNLIEDLNSNLAVTDFTQYMGNPYELVYLMSTLQYYKADIEDADNHIEGVKDAMMSFYYEGEYTGEDYAEDPVGSGNWVLKELVIPGTGFYHYGFSDDSNAKMIIGLKSFYESDDDIKAIVDALIANVKNSTNEKFQVDGYGYGYNSDSTGLVLSGLSIYGNEDAANYYKGLITFESTEVKGGYLYDDSSDEPDPIYATRDALEGLVSYERMLEGEKSIYDLSSYDDTKNDDGQSYGTSPVAIGIIVAAVFIILVIVFMNFRNKKK